MKNYPKIKITTIKHNYDKLSSHTLKEICYFLLCCENFISSKPIMESSNMKNTLKDSIICTAM